MCCVCALGHLHSLLSSNHTTLPIKQLLACVGDVLQQGLEVKDVVCGGMADKVQRCLP